MNKLRDLPLAWGLHECVLPGSGCWDQVGAARVARTPCKLQELETLLGERKVEDTNLAGTLSSVSAPPPKLRAKVQSFSPGNIKKHKLL